MRRAFDENVKENLGPQAVAEDFDDMNMGETPMFEKYEEEDSRRL